MKRTRPPRPELTDKEAFDLCADEVGLMLQRIRYRDPSIGGLTALANLLWTLYRAYEDVGEYEMAILLERPASQALLTRHGYSRDEIREMQEDAYQLLHETQIRRRRHDMHAVS